jgi:ABC-type antimicrobial peptide transport system permease subunit
MPKVFRMPIALNTVVNASLLCRRDGRLALGALPRQIVRRVVRDALATAALGVAIGVALSLAAGRLLTDLLFGLAPGDPLTLGAVALTLLLVAGVATLVPARRILRLDPAVTLRQ